MVSLVRIKRITVVHRAPWLDQISGQQHAFSTIAKRAYLHLSVGKLRPCLCCSLVHRRDERSTSILIEPKVRPSRQPLQLKVGPNGSFADVLPSDSAKSTKRAHSMPDVYEDDAGEKTIC